MGLGSPVTYIGRTIRKSISAKAAKNIAANLKNMMYSAPSVPHITFKSSSLIFFNTLSQLRISRGGLP